MCLSRGRDRLGALVWASLCFYLYSFFNLISAFLSPPLSHTILSLSYSLSLTPLVPSITLLHSLSSLVRHGPVPGLLGGLSPRVCRGTAPHTFRCA